MNAFNGEKPRQTIGRLFQNITTERFQEYDSNINSSKDNTDYQWICDIYDQASDSLIELKSHKIIDPDETTLDTFEKILKQDEVRRKKNQNNSGLFYQLTEMSKRSKSFAVMVGCYNEDVNKLKNQLISNDPKGYASFTEYRFLIVQPDSVYWCSYPQRDFWKRAKVSWEINDGHCKSFLRVVLASFDFVRLYEITDQRGRKRSLIDLLKQLEFGLTEDQMELAFDGKPYYNHVTDTQQLEIKLDKPTQTWIEKEKQAQESIEAEQNETTQEQAKIDPVEKITKDQVTLFKPEQLELIEKAVADHEPFSAISVQVGHSSNYIAQIISQPKDNYTREEYNLFRNWFIAICIESSHWETPIDRCNLDQLKLITNSLRTKFRSHKAINTGLRKSKVELESQVKEITESRVRQRNTINSLELKIKQQEEEIKELEVTNKNSNEAWFDLREHCIKLKSEILDLKNQLDSQEKNEMDEVTTLKLEAYQAEIKKLQAENEEYKETNEGLETESENLKTCIDELGLEVERLTDVLELEEEQKFSKDVLHEHFEKLRARDERVIDGLLDLIDEQKLTINSFRKRN